MSNQRKKIAIFGSSLTGRYKCRLCRELNIAAEELGVDLVYFNSYGKLRSINSTAEDHESGFLEFVDLDQFDGIVFDGEGYNIEGMADRVERKLRSAKCPVVSISSHVEGFYNIEFDDAGGLRKMVEHFINDHHFTRIGYMSGYLSHPDAQLRLNEFRSVMREHGFPEDGVGMFEGDFWYNKGVEAAHYFLSLPQRPEAIVCANDYMAISLIDAFRQMGIRVPENIAVSGYDGTVEVKSISREAGSRTKIAVWSKDPNVDAVGACIGAKRSRITAIVNELSGEKIDIIPWSEVPEEEVLKTIITSEEEKTCTVIVPNNQLSLAIGNKGQNAKLAAKLTGFKIDIKPRFDSLTNEEAPEMSPDFVVPVKEKPETEEEAEETEAAEEETVVSEDTAENAETAPETASEAVEAEAPAEETAPEAETEE